MVTPSRGFAKHIDALANLLKRVKKRMFHRSGIIYNDSGSLYTKFQGDT